MIHSRLWLLTTASVLLMGTIGCSANAAPNSTSNNSAAGTSAVELAQAQSPAPQQRTQGQDNHSSGRRHRRIDFAAAAARLGTTEANLRQALGLPAQDPGNGDRPRPNLQQAATRLNVSEERLRQALGITIDPQTGQPIRPGTRPNLQQAASQLGVTEAQLRTALGIPAEGDRPRRTRLDIAGAATRLGVTQQQLLDALELPNRSPGDSQHRQPGNQQNN